MIFVMDTAIMTAFGTYKYWEVTPAEAKEYLSKEFVSAVGHYSTADFLTGLFGVEIQYNRIQIRMQKGDKAIVIKFLQRLPYNKKLTREEIASVQYQLGIMERIE